MEIKLKDLLEAGCHFGHQVTRWNPKMKPYIFTARDNVHIFDLVKTKEGLEQAAAFAKATAANGGKIIFVGTKKQAKGVIKETALGVGMPYISERWVGGTITNWDVINKNIRKLKDLKDKRERNELKDFTKKERLLIDREIIKLEHTFGGLVGLEKIPEAVFIVDVRKEMGAAKEAGMRGVKVIGLVDTNSDPNLVDYIIPANDDAARSVELIVKYIGEAVEAGKKIKKEKETKGTEGTKETEGTEGTKEKEKVKKIPSKGVSASGGKSSKPKVKKVIKTATK